MKNGKKPTRKQIEFLKKKGYEVDCYLIVKNASDVLTVYNKETGRTEDIGRD